MKKAVLLFWCCFVWASARAGEGIWQITFKDKGPQAEQLLQHPELFLSQRAIERRWLQQIPIDVSDLPVYSNYLEQITQHYPVLATSKWLNSIWIKTVEDPRSLLANMDFILDIQPWKGLVAMPASVQFSQQEYGAAHYQADMLQLPPIHQRSYTGKGVLIAVLDAGFEKVDSSPAFASLRPRIKAARDFVNPDGLPYRSSNHGTLVLSTIGLYWKDTLLGTAPEADFLLARTEDTGSETPLEELNYQMAAEWADSMGADILHASLGYSRFDAGHESYTYAEMDGKNTIVTRAAQSAFGKGILVVNSAGNEGWGPWFKITAPCDGKDVLCVGALEETRVLAKFSSTGPSYDGRIKPDVVALGARAAAVNELGQPVPVYGTSFSAPLVAGLAACLIQAHPQAGNRKILDAIRKSAHQYHHPDTLQGYGIPNAFRADSLLSAWPVYEDHCGDLHLELFPNPGSREVQLKSTETLKGARLEVFDASGKTWISTSLEKNLQVHLLNTQDLPAGIYRIRITQAGQSCLLSLLLR